MSTAPISHLASNVARRYWGSVDKRSHQGDELLARAWDELCAKFDEEHSPDIWVTFDLVKPMKLETAHNLVRLYWTKLCRKYDTHCHIRLFSDIQEHSKHE